MLSSGSDSIEPKERQRLALEGERGFKSKMGREQGAEMERREGGDGSESGD